MNLKIGFINRLMFLVFICLSLIDDVERKKDEGTGLLVDANPVVLAIDVVSTIIGFVVGIDSLIDMFTSDDEDQKNDDQRSQDQRNQIIWNTELITKLDDLQQSLASSFQIVDNGFADIKKALEENFAEGMMENALEEDKNYVLEVNRKLNLIELRYNQDFSRIRRGIENYRNETLNRYASSIVGSNDLKDLLRDVLFATKLQQGLIFNKNIFEIAGRFLKNEKHHNGECDRVPIYDQLSRFYHYILKTVVKGYTMIVLSYQYLKMKSTDKAFYKERQIEYQNYHKEAIIQITEAAKYYLQTVDALNREFSYACLPQTWEEGKNYFRIKNYATFNVLSDSCEHGTEPTLTIMCNDVFNDVNSLSYFPAPREYSQEYKNRSKRCIVPDNSHAEEKNSFYRDCASDHHSDVYLSVRKISLTPTYCDHDRNEVVTSARFREKEGMIFIEVQCGVFVDGKIDKNSLRWNTAQRDSYSVENPPPNHLLIKWDLKSFPLMDYVTPESEFIVGLGFKKINDFISLEVFSKNIFDSSGIQSFSMPDSYSVSRTELQLTSLSLVLDQQNKNYEISEPNKFFVKLYPTTKYDEVFGRFQKFDAKVVPLFDMSEYKPPVASPLSGIGLMHKSVPNYAGFLALKFITSKKMLRIPDDYAEKLVIKPVNHL